ncbi:MAG: hypothetical protein WB947_08415 [Thermoplasmata archaeon]
MGSKVDPEPPFDPEIEELRRVVPGRAVLTELARGFLLVHESNPGRAVRFAETFLKECTGESRSERAETPPPFPKGRLKLGLLPRGAVDPTNFPPVR